MPKYTALEEQVAEAMTDSMDQKGLWELAYQDNLRTLNDCTEEELREFENTYLPTHEQKHCSNCRWQSSDRGLCWCEDRSADPASENGAVFSEISAQTEAENRPEDEVCKYWMAYPESIRA